MRPQESTFHLSIADVARRANVGVSTIHGAITRGKLVADRDGNGRVYVHRGSLGCGMKIIVDRLRKGGVPSRTRLDITWDDIQAARASGESVAQMAQRWGCTQASLSKRIRKGPPKVRQITAAEVVAARRAGLTQQEIAKQLGCSLDTVRARLRQAGQP